VCVRRLRGQVGDVLALDRRVLQEVHVLGPHAADERRRADEVRQEAHAELGRLDCALGLFFDFFFPRFSCSIAAYRSPIFHGGADYCLELRRRAAQQEVAQGDELDDVAGLEYAAQDRVRVGRTIFAVIVVIVVIVAVGNAHLGEQLREEQQRADSRPVLFSFFCFSFFFFSTAATATSNKDAQRRQKARRDELVQRRRRRPADDRAAPCCHLHRNVDSFSDFSDLSDRLGLGLFAGAGQETSAERVQRPPQQRDIFAVFVVFAVVARGEQPREEVRNLGLGRFCAVAPPGGVARGIPQERPPLVFFFF
jgi:hypothetical protein